MQSWCTPEEVAARVAGSPPLPLCQEYADHATSILYVSSGRRFPGEQVVETVHQVNRRGYIKLGMWSPVREVHQVTINNVLVPFLLSPAGTYVTVGLQYANAVAALVMDVGQNPPVMGQKAAAALAADMLRGDARYHALGDSSDKQPESRLLSISRQGVTYTYVDPSDLAEKDLTGVDVADKFLRSVNPHKFRYQPKVVSTT